MKPLVACLILLLPVAAPIADEKNEPITPAMAVMTGKATEFRNYSGGTFPIKPGEDVQKKMAEALRSVTVTKFSLDEKTGIVVALPANIFNFNDVFKVYGKPMAVEGILTSTDNAILVEASGTKGAKRMPLLIAQKMTLVDEKNKDSFPAENQATIEGIASKGEIKVGSDTAGWAIRNGGGRIPINLPKDAKPPETGAKIRASGKVRVVEGQLLLDATKVDAAKK